MTAAAKYLTHFCNVFGRPVTQQRDDSARLISAGDRKALMDVVTMALDELHAIQTLVFSALIDTPATNAEPGSAEKIEILRQRVDQQRALFLAADLERR